MYIAINNALSSILSSVNVVGALIIRVPLTGIECKIHGFLDAFIVSMSVTLVALVAIRTYLKVILNFYLDTGKYDHRYVNFFFFIKKKGKMNKILNSLDYG